MDSFFQQKYFINYMEVTLMNRGHTLVVLYKLYFYWWVCNLFGPSYTPNVINANKTPSMYTLVCNHLLNHLQ